MKIAYFIFLLTTCSRLNAIEIPSYSPVSIGCGGNNLIAKDPFSANFNYSDLMTKPHLIIMAVSHPYFRVDINQLAMKLIQHKKKFTNGIHYHYWGNSIFSSSEILLINALSDKRWQVQVETGICHLKISKYNGATSYLGSLCGTFKIDNKWKSTVQVILRNNHERRSPEYYSVFGLQYSASSNLLINMAHETSPNTKSSINVCLVAKHGNQLEYFGGYTYNRNTFGIGIKYKKGHLKYLLSMAYHCVLGMGNAIGFENAF